MTVWNSHLPALVRVVFPALITHRMLLVVVVVVGVVASCLSLVAVTRGTSHLLVTVASCPGTEKSQQLPEV